MAVRHSWGQLAEILKKYKYIVLVLVLGIVLMAVPSISETSGMEVECSETGANPVEDIEQKLAMILQQIHGAGDVSVMLTRSKGEETIFQVDTKNDEGTDSAKSNNDTVIIADHNRSESGLVRQVNPPEYLGAVIVCQGADDPEVRLAITDAVSKITGLGANHISVLKMK